MGGSSSVVKPAVVHQQLYCLTATSTAPCTYYCASSLPLPDRLLPRNKAAQLYSDPSLPPPSLLLLLTRSGVLSSGLCYPPCPPSPPNATTPAWTWAIDASSNNITCTLASCPDGSMMCGSYCIKSAEVDALGASCGTVSSVRGAVRGRVSLRKSAP